MIRIVIVIFIVGFFAADTSGQADNTLWATVRLRIVPNDKNAIDIRPISRFHENYSDYRNSSIDIAYRRKLSPLITLGLLSRTWFLKDGRNRQFIWPAILLKKKSGKTTFDTRFMYHWALDIKEVPDADFFRVKSAVGYPLGAKMSAKLAIEGWYQFDEQNDINRIRFELSLGYKLSDHISAGILYRRENDKIRPDFDMIVTTITYQI